MTAARDESRLVGSNLTCPDRLDRYDQSVSAPAKPRILVIDDEPHISGFVARALEHAGYRVEVADDGPDGIDRATSGGCDLVILDLIMPGLDGRSVLRSILKAKPGQ